MKKMSNASGLLSVPFKTAVGSMRPIGFYFTLFFILGFLGTYFGMGWKSLGLALSLACGMTAGGSLFGFLFGIPRVLQRNGREDASEAGSMAASNTNLEQVSDWLTAIIIGASLVQLREIGAGLDWISTKVAVELGATPATVNTGSPKGYALGYFSILYFFIGGFLFSYLFTRLNLIEAFSMTEWKIRQARTTAQNATTEKDLLLEQVGRTLEERSAGTAPRSLKSEGDQNKGAFGGISTANGREFTAKITPLSSDAAYCRIDLKVTGLPTSPLFGTVTFHLHESFKPKDRIEVVAVGNEATFTVIAYGAFTVGAVMDGGETRLELDLSDSSLGGPEDWRKR